MDFDFSDDQRLLKDSVDRMVGDRYGFEQRRKYKAEPDGWSRALWAQDAELGLLGLPFDEAHGGFGGGPVETMIVMEAVGRGLLLEPYFATVVLGGGLLRHGAPESVKAGLLPKVAAGEMLLAFAHLERHSRYDMADVGVRAEKGRDGWTITGEKSLVLHGDVADHLLVTARVSGERRDPDGIGLFLVDGHAPGVTRRGFPTQDGLRAAELSFAGASASLVCEPGAAFPVVERVVDEAIAAIAAKSVGVMGEMHDATVDYMKQRKQFGRAIGEFQALQHRAVDMYVALEQAKSMALYATVMAGETDPIARRRAMSAAKVMIGRSGRRIGQEAVQLHGGIAMTAEYKVGHYFKRMTMLEMLFGDTDAHLASVADSGSVFA